MVEYNRTTINKEGVYQEGDTRYTVNAVVVDNQLTRLSVSIQKKKIEQILDEDKNATPIENYVDAGHIVVESGRRIGEFVDPEEDVVPYFTVFQKILDEVLGKTATQTSTKTK